MWYNDSISQNGYVKLTGTLNLFEWKFMAVSVCFSVQNEAAPCKMLKSCIRLTDISRN